MLDVNQLSRSYGDFKAVDKVSFTIAKGEIVGLLGHNGAGKTTIMKMLSGYLEPNNGTIQINGQEINKNLKAIQSQIGYLPENLPIYPEMTVADYLDYTAELKGLKGETKFQELQRVIKATELEAKLLQPITTLSRGFKQRVGVAQAILGKPKLLILDEPTNGLDPSQTEQMRQLIKQVAKDATVILSTHIMQEVDAVCDRAIIIRNGQVAVDAKLEELRHSNIINLACSLNLQQLIQQLQTITAIDSIKLIDSTEAKSKDTAHDSFNFNIKLSLESDHTFVRSQIAKQIIQANAALYSLSQQHLDLEALFKQVNQSPMNIKEVKNAA